MKVIFIEDVPNVARAGEAKEVADGYGRNYLLPRKLAVLANSQASAAVEAQLKKIVVRRVQEEAEMAEVASKLNGMEVTLKAKAGEKERLYGSITGADIADELSSAGLDIDKRKIELEEPIRQLGSYEVTVRFTHDIAAVINLTVVADKVAEEKEEKKEEKKGKTKAKKKSKEKAEEAVAEAKAEKEVTETAEEKIEETEEKVEEAGEKEVETGE